MGLTISMATCITGKKKKKSFSAASKQAQFYGHRRRTAVHTDAHKELSSDLNNRADDCGVPADNVPSDINIDSAVASAINISITFMCFYCRVPFASVY